VAGQLAAGTWLQYARAARLLLLNSRPAHRRAPAGRGAEQHLVATIQAFAEATARLCWLNTDSTHICELAILGVNDYLPWRAAKACFQHQRDFNYLEHGICGRMPRWIATGFTSRDALSCPDPGRGPAVKGTTSA